MTRKNTKQSKGNMKNNVGHADREVRVEERSWPTELPLLMVPNIVVFPKMIIPLEVPQECDNFIDHVMAGDGYFVITARQYQNSDSIYDIGTVVYLKQKEITAAQNIRLRLKSIDRVRIIKLLPPDPFPRARVQHLADIYSPEDLESKALTRNVKNEFDRFLQLSARLAGDVKAELTVMKDPGELADAVATFCEIHLEKKQDLLEELDVKARLNKVLPIIVQEVELLELSSKIQRRVRNQLDKSHREYYLKEQLDVIRQELGQSAREAEILPELKAKIETAKLSVEAKTEVDAQFRRLKSISRASPEFLISQSYIEWLLDLPWRNSEGNDLPLAKVRTILDRDHFGLEKVKKRILEFLAVRKLKNDNKGPILCLVGPPGTGKTSMGHSIAKALGRRFYRFSLGGMRDEAEIRGHRRTYVGALPGRIIQGLKKVGVNNPVMMLDEIDKLGQPFQGDPASALLEVLDPEQNDSFVDHYLGIKFDLSNILFIATANRKDTIPEPLFDRMEVIELSGYTEEDKVNIARQHLVPKQLRENGLTRDRISFHKRALTKIVSGYTRESGLRNLERKIAAICRQVAYEIALGKTGKFVITQKEVLHYLGPPKNFPEVAQLTSVPGVATGLAWTPAGGEILFIEATKVRGNKQLVLTGKLGEVMRESAMTALSFLKSRSGMMHMENDFFENHDIHIHVPAGSIPKDGPSAGITILLALSSLFVDRPIKGDTASTGEVTLQGNILPVGGLKEKVLAAKRAGVRKIILPQQNRYDLERLSSTVKEGLQFHLITHADEALRLASADG